MRGGDVFFKGTERFSLQREIGRGGMGVVYEALDHQTGTRVALKTLLHLDGRNIYRFKNEFRALADLHHPNLVSFRELFFEDGRWFFTMDLVEGETFLHWVRPGYPHAPASSPTHDTQEDPAPATPAPTARANPHEALLDERRLRDALLLVVPSSSARSAMLACPRSVSAS